MPIYLVETEATVRRFYRVEADNPKAAEEASSDMQPTDEEDANECSVSVTLLPDTEL